MNRFKHYKETKKDDPVYLLFRNNKLVLTGSNAPRLFSSPEHYVEHKKAYNSCFLRSDELIKYVPERRSEWITAGGGELICSYCAYEAVYRDIGALEQLWEFCPHCGAKMIYKGGADAKD